MKGILGSNTIEANARMCMTSAVTGYFKSLGSDTPPTCYADIELADMICFWGHNALAYAIMEDHDDAVAWDFLKEHTEMH